ncbi:MAG: hypothetical protein DHS20C21_03960 [Gemmatimonadota bacterium]|nr:MAG: hypothetical protein DHS20C21_03960 [Gemmatimonadota bacterium]
MVRLALRIGVAGILAAAFFAWGIVAQKNDVFPWPQLKRLTNPEHHRPRELVESRSPRTAEALAALPYAQATADINTHLRDVLTFDEERAFPGFNFYSSRTAEAARLIAMDGTTVHEWSYDTRGEWMSTVLQPNGDLFAIVEDRQLICLDADSNLLWAWDGRAHHDVAVHDGEIHVLSRRERIVPAIHAERETLEDTVIVLSMDGAVLREYSVLDAVSRSPHGYLIPWLEDVDLHVKGRPTGKPLDVMHVNSIEIFDGSLGDRSPLFARGNLLMASRHINAVFILDGDTHDVLWLWGPMNIALPHHPTLLPEGRVLLFDNGLRESRVLEVDPADNRVVWRFREKGFFTRSRGGAQRLPNGNTLVTESDPGYAFEVTPQGEVVWKFANPDVSDDDKRSAIWRMIRFAPGTLTFLEEGLDPVSGGM